MAAILNFANNYFSPRERSWLPNYHQLNLLLNLILCDKCVLIKCVALLLSMSKFHLLIDIIITDGDYQEINAVHDNLSRIQQKTYVIP